MTDVLTLVAKANARGPTSGLTDVPDDEVELPKGFDRISAKLFEPLKVGAFTLSHRIVHAALGRARAMNGCESPLAVEYFAQRVTPGSLSVSQATGVSPKYTLSAFAAGVQREDQLKALGRVIDVVHENGGIWFQQLFHPGRAATAAMVKRGHTQAGIPEPSYGWKPVSSSDVAESGINAHTGEIFTTPHPLTIEEIQEIRQNFKDSSINAVKAGADGIEVLSGTGFLLDQFLHDNINKREDIYGGSIENRARLTLEVVDDIASTGLGYQKIGVRLTPFSNFHETDGSQPLEQLLYLVKELAKRGVAYVDVREARVSRNLGIQENLHRLVAKGISPEDLSLRQFRKLLSEVKPEDPSFTPTVLFGSGGYTAPTALLTVQEDLADGVVFGRRFISSPDLVRRIRYGYPLTPYDRSTFYTHGAKGYITYKSYQGPISPLEEKELLDSQWIPTADLKNQLGKRSASSLNGISKLSVEETSKPLTNGTANGVKTPISTGTQENLKKVAIIGAGISGIESASAFKRVGGFDIKIFERKAVPGGAWSYHPSPPSVPVFPGINPDLVNPPLAKPEGPFPVTLPRNKQQRFTSSPIYETLVANIPYNVMSGGSSLPLPVANGETAPLLTGRQIAESVEETVKGYAGLISYNTTVENVEKAGDGTLTLLLRRENEDDTDTWYTEDFGHLVVATGHNSVPRVPDIKGLESWKGELRHTVNWRSGEEFKDKRILIIGSSESAIDVALQSLPYTKQIYVSQRTAHPRYPKIFTRPGIEVVPTVESITESSILFSNGQEVTGIDTIVFATGYFYTYPFLPETIRPKTDGYRVPGLYQHIFDMYNSDSIAFIGVANGTLSWTSWEKSAFLVALLWSGKIHLPPIEEQKKWEARRLAEVPERYFHVFITPPHRVLYWADLNELAHEYFASGALDDELLREFPYEWMVTLAETLKIKEKRYGITS